MSCPQTKTGSISAPRSAVANKRTASVRMFFVRFRLRMFLRTLFRLSMLLRPCLRTWLRLWTLLFLMLDRRGTRFRPFLGLRPCLWTLGR